MGWTVFNFVIFAGLLVFALRKPMGEFVKIRHISIKDELEKVRDLLRGAQNQYEELTAKLNSIDVEVGTIMGDFKKRAGESKAQIVSSAKSLSGQMVEDSKSSAEAGYVELKRELQVGFVEEILKNAEVIIREKLTGDDRIRLREEFSTKLKSSGATSQSGDTR